MPSPRQTRRINQVLAVCTLFGCLPGASAGQQGCPAASGGDAEAGWSAYRRGDVPAARARFQAALTRCPEDLYAATGMGYVALREGDEGLAHTLFSKVVAARPDDVDALVGLGMWAWRAGDLARVRDLFLHVRGLDPDNATAAEYLARLPEGPGDPTPDRRREPPPATQAPPPSQEDPADAAWSAGDTERARALYRARLQDNPADEVALHRLALMEAWDERYAESLALFDRLLAVSPVNLEARLDRTRVRAWSGDVSGALDELDGLLADHPDYGPALEARATFQSWEGRYDEALESYDALLAIAPGDAAARRRQAQVLSWATRYGAAREAYDSLLAVDPDDVDARLGLARVLTFTDDIDGAVVQYRTVLAARPGSLEGLQGLGRALSWGGRLVEGEGAFRRAVARAPDDVSVLVGLAQNLRWQGRNAAALEVLERARTLAPSDGDVREQLRWVRSTLGAQAHPRVVVENDSDDNHMVTTALSASWHPVPRLGVRADAYRRTLDQNALSRSSAGLTVSGSWQFEPGWTVSAGVGGSDGNGTATSTFAAWSLGLASPGRYPYSGSLTLGSAALDATAALVEHGVRLTELGVTGRWSPLPGWRVDGAVGRATFRGSEANQRTSAALAASRRLTPRWTLGAGVRGFSFEKDLLDGYFDPDFYGIAEATGRWLLEPRSWSFLVEVAPGAQKVTSDGSLTGAIRASARVAYRFGVGREVSLSGGYSSTGLQTFSTGASDYRYTAFILGGSWVF